MKNDIPKFNTLHEAIIHVLENEPDQAATFRKIGVEIENNNLWRQPSSNNFPSDKEIKNRTVLSKRYKKLFVLLAPNKIQLKRSTSDSE